MSKRHSLPAFLILALLPVSGSVRADWFIASNPVSGNPEAVWSTVPLDESDTEIFYSYLDGSGWAPSIRLTTNAYGDSEAVLAFDADGGRKVVWGTGESTDRILLRTLPSSGGSWSDVTVLSDEGEDSRNPCIAVDSSGTYVGYEVAPSSGGRTVKATKIDGDGGVERSTIRTTPSTSALQTVLHSEGGHLWIDWVDSVSQLGWSERSGGSWGSPQYTSYSGPTDVAAGRSRIRSRVLGL